MVNTYNKGHSTFILTPLFSLLKDGVNACSSLPDGIGSFPIKEYFFQSLFLRMTGAHEQKMKCICWELASVNYRYRYEYLRSNEYGECSDYDSKHRVYCDLIRCIKDIDNSFETETLLQEFKINTETLKKERHKWEDKVKKKLSKKADEEIARQTALCPKLSEEVKSKIRTNILSKLPEKDFEAHQNTLHKQIFAEQLRKSLYSILDGSLLEKWSPSDYRFFKQHSVDIIRRGAIGFTDTSLFAGNLVSDYKSIVYEHRNRCAHNLQSYQSNLPSLNLLSRKDYRYHNYFFRFAILILMDEIFIRLYRKYMEVRDSLG